MSYLSRSLCICTLSLVVSSMVFARESLCAKDEQIAFSCTVGHKLVSLCASADLSKTTGYVQYRYGKKDKVEFVFPESKGHPSVYFRWGVNAYAGGGADYYRFSNNGYDYVVYSGMGKGWVKEGVVVEKDGKRLSNLACQDNALGPDNWQTMYSAGLPEIDVAGNGFDLP